MPTPPTQKKYYICKSDGTCLPAEQGDPGAKPYSSIDVCFNNCHKGGVPSSTWYKCDKPSYKCLSTTDATKGYTKTKAECDADCVPPGGLSAGIIVLIVLVSVILLGILAFIIWKRKHKPTLAPVAPLTTPPSSPLSSPMLTPTSSPVITPTSTVPTESSEASTQSSSEGEVVTGGF